MTNERPVIEKKEMLRSERSDVLRTLLEIGPFDAIQKLRETMYDPPGSNRLHSDRVYHAIAYQLTLGLSYREALYSLFPDGRIPEEAEAGLKSSVALAAEGFFAYHSLKYDGVRRTSFFERIPDMDVEGKSTYRPPLFYEARYDQFKDAVFDALRLARDPVSLGLARAFQPLLER